MGRHTWRVLNSKCCIPIAPFEPLWTLQTLQVHERWWKMPWHFLSIVTVVNSLMAGVMGFLLWFWDRKVRIESRVECAKSWDDGARWQSLSLCVSEDHNNSESSSVCGCQSLQGARAFGPLSLLQSVFRMQTTVTSVLHFLPQQPVVRSSDYLSAQHFPIMIALPTEFHSWIVSVGSLSIWKVLFVSSAPL